MSIQISSAVFPEGGTIPKKFTCDGEDVSPPLNWSGVPQGAKSQALVIEDPDSPSGTWVHWVLYGIPPGINSLAEGAQGPGIQGLNDFRKTGYGGPCPPRGKPHQYFFKIYALDTDLQLKPGLKKSDLEKAMRGHILAEGQLMAIYGRSS